MPSDALLFLKEFVRDPKRVGSVTPSGIQLARRMVTAADIHDDHVVVELGAGTGPVTREIRRAHPAVPLLALEPGPDLAARLRLELPDVEVSERFAQDLPEVVAEWGHAKVDRVVSSLPWTVWSPEVIGAGLRAVGEVLAPGGRMVTFSYVHSQALLPGARRFRAMLEEHFARVERTETQWRNVPPALVFVCDMPRMGGAAPGQR